MCSKALHNDFHAPVMVNSARKHNKPQFSLGKTEVRSRCGCAAPCLPGSKIHNLGTLLVQNSVANKAFEPYAGGPIKPEEPRKQFAPGFVQLGLQILLERVCTAVLRPNISDTAFIFRKTDARVAEMSINILSSVVQNPHQVHTSIVTIIMWCLAPVVCMACYGWRVGYV